MCGQRPEVVKEFIYRCRGNASKLGEMKEENKKYKSEKQTNIKRK